MQHSPADAKNSDAMSNNGASEDAKRLMAKTMCVASRVSQLQAKAPSRNCKIGRASCRERVYTKV